MNKVNSELLTRREFIRLGTGVAAVSGLTPEPGASSLLAPDNTHSATPQSATSRRWVVETEMQAADDFLRSFENAAGGWEKRASTTLFQETMTPPFSFRFDALPINAIPGVQQSFSAKRFRLGRPPI